jgi:hypothetical protein
MSLQCDFCAFHGPESHLYLKPVHGTSWDTLEWEKKVPKRPIPNQFQMSQKHDCNWPNFHFFVVVEANFLQVHCHTWRGGVWPHDVTAHSDQSLHKLCLSDSASLQKEIAYVCWLVASLDWFYGKREWSAEFQQAVAFKRSANTQKHPETVNCHPAISHQLCQDLT